MPRLLMATLAASVLAVGPTLIATPSAHADVDNGEFAISTNHAPPGSYIAAAPIINHGCPSGQGVKTWQIELDFFMESTRFNAQVGGVRADGSWSLRLRVPRASESTRPYHVSAKCFGKDGFGGNVEWQYDPITFRVDPPPPIRTDLRTTMSPAHPRPGGTITIVATDPCPAPAGPQTTSWEAAVLLYDFTPEPADIRPADQQYPQLTGGGTWRATLRIPKSANVAHPWKVVARCQDTDRTDGGLAYTEAEYRQTAVPLRPPGGGSTVTPSSGGDTGTCPPLDPKSVPGCGGVVVPPPGGAPTPVDGSIPGSSATPGGDPTSGPAPGDPTGSATDPTFPSLTPAAATRQPNDHGGHDVVGIVIVGLAAAFVCAGAAWGTWYWRRSNRMRE